MKLNKTIRESILESVMSATDFQKRQDELHKETGKKIRECYISRLPDNFLELTKNLPKEWFHHVSYCWNRNGKNFDFEPFHRPVNFDDSVHGIEDTRRVIETYEIEKNKIDEEYQSARMQVLAFLHSCKTTEQVIEGFPQFERHIPKSAGVTYPVIVNVNHMVHALANSGFDTAVRAEQ